MERRKNQRAPISITSTIRYKDRVISGAVLNISLQGMLIHIPEQLPLNEEVDVEIIIANESLKRSLVLPSRVIRSDKNGTAVKLLNLNLDSCITIKDMLVKQSEDSDKVVQEFCAFIEMRQE